MEIETITAEEDPDWVAAKFHLANPRGTLTVRARRASGFPWKIRHSKGEASLAFKRGGQFYYRSDLESLCLDLKGKRISRIGDAGRLVFDDGTQVQPYVDLRPRDLLDKSKDEIRWSSDVKIPGMSP